VEVWERGNSSSGALVYGAARESFLVEEAEWTGDAHGNTRLRRFPCSTFDRPQALAHQGLRNAPAIQSAEKRNRHFGWPKEAHE
jgi:hypothetical protein